MDLQDNIDIGIRSDKARTGAARVRAALDSIRRKSRQLANSVSRDTKRSTGGFKMMAKVIAGVGGALAARSMIKSTTDFGQAVADLSAITGATGKDLDFLRQKSMEFGETTTLSASQAAEAFRVIASAKPDLLSNVEALAQVTEQAIALAEATGDDLPTAANTLGASLNMFNKGAEESARFINVLAAGSKFGAAQVGEMAESLKFAGGIAANMSNLSFEETNASLQLLSQFAIKGGEAGTQLRMILLALETQANDNFKPSIVGMSQAFKNLEDAQLSTTAAAKLFGSRNVNAANILIQNRKRVDDLTGALTGSTIAYEQQSRRVDTLSGDVKALKSAYEGLELNIGANLEPTMRALTQSATESIRALSRNPLLKTATVNTLDTVHTALQDIKNVFRSLKGIVTESGGGAAVWAGAWEGAIKNIVNWTKFLWQQFVVGGPANLKLAITYMIAAFDRLKIGLTQIVRNTTALMLSMFDVFRIDVVELFQLIGPSVNKVFTSIAHTVGQTFDGIRVQIAEAIDLIIGEVQQKIFGVARALANMGFDDRAEEMVRMGIALGGIADNGRKAAQAAIENERARKAEKEAIEATINAIKKDANEKRSLARQTADEMIAENNRHAESAKQASRVAVQGAIDERDATIAAIEAMRTARAEVHADTGGDEIQEIDLSELPKKKFEEVAEELTNIGKIGEGVFDDIAGGIADMATSGKADFADMAMSIIQDIIRIYLKSQLLKALTSFFGGGSNVPTEASGGTLAVTSGGVIPRAHSGLDFRVGGAGGTDSQLVQFKATPGEEVSVKTPQQQRNSAGAVTLKQVNHIDARGADAARIEAMMPGLLEQTRQRTLADVIRLRDRGALRK